MRLIDADAFCAFLREVSTRQHYETLLTQKDKYPTVADVIEEVCCDLDGTSLNGFDNAPTVDALPREYHDRVLDMTVAELQACQANLRPQGEWIKKQETPASVSYYCSNCKMSNLPVLPYCPWCGAKMKGEQND